jgi:hypothetical protein
MKKIICIIASYVLLACPTFSQISLIGSATSASDWTTDFDMTENPLGSNKWHLTIALNAGECKFRSGHNWTTSWGANIFPGGLAVLNSPDNMPVPTSGTYEITFDLNSSYFNFQLLPANTPANIGINNTDPQTSLDVKGGIRIRPIKLNIASNTITIPQNESYVVINAYPPATADFTISVGGAYEGQSLTIDNLQSYVGILGGLSIPSGVTQLIYSEGSWKKSVATSTSITSWKIDGNNGTNGLTNFIGTTDDVPLKIKTKNEVRIEIGNDALNGNIGIGTNPDIASKASIFTDKSMSTLEVLNKTPSSIYQPTYAVKGLNKNEAYGIRYGGYFESSGGEIESGRNTGVYGYASLANTSDGAFGVHASTDKGVALYATATGNGGIAGIFNGGDVRMEKKLTVGSIYGDLNQISSYAKDNTNAFFSTSILGKTPDIVEIGKIAGTSYVGVRSYSLSSGGYAFQAIGDTHLSGSLKVGSLALPSGYLVSINGKVIAEELRIQNSDLWPDYVFEKNYKLMPLHLLEKKLTLDKHLPDVPSAKDIEQNGIIVGDMQRVLLKKIEELTLYIIEQNKRIEALEKSFKN